MGLTRVSGGPERLRLLRIGGAGESFVIRMEDESGRVLEVAASREQIDMLADEVDDALLKDEDDEG